MGAALPVHGVTENEDLHVHWVRKDTRPWLLKYADEVGFIAPGVVIGGAILPLLFPQFTDLLFVLGMLVYWMVGARIRRSSLQMPMRPAPRVKLNPFRKTHRNQAGAAVVNSGILLLGYELGSGTAIVQDDDNVRQHYLVLGTTGSGKTRFILSVIYIALLWNSGAIFVDGKGDSLTFWLLYRIARRLDRTDDLMVLNFLNGGREAGNRPSPVTRLSNTNNGWQSSTSSMIVEMIAGMMPSSGGDAEYWRGRAKIMVGSVIRLLTDMRNRGEISLDVQALRDHMPLSKLMDLVKRNDFDDFRKAGLRAYLMDLGIQEREIEVWGTENQLDFAPKVIEQHGYLQQQLTEILGELGDNLRHIFGVRFGEVHWPTVLYKRKIVFVMLPVLEKSTDTVRGYGRLIFSGIRSALAPALGDTLEGWNEYVMSRKIAGSDIPMFLIFDEWGNYATQGAAAMVSQVRGLGISAWFLSQDEPGMRKDESLDRETGSLIGSTNTKMCMLIEEMEHTYKLFNLRSHKSYVNRREGQKVDEYSLNQDYYDTGQTRLEESDRISPRDLVSQGLGEAHITNRDKLLRARLLYIDPPEVPFAQINQWLDAMPNSKHAFDKYGKLSESARDFFDKTTVASRNLRLDQTSPSRVSRHLNALFSGFEKAAGAVESRTEAAICAVGFTDYAARKNDYYARQMIQSSVRKLTDTAPEFNDQVENQPSADHLPTDQPPYIDNNGPQTPPPARQIDAQSEAEVRQGIFMDMLDESLSELIVDIDGLRADAKDGLSLKGQIKHAAYIMDDDEDFDPDSAVQRLRENLPDHPAEPTPSPRSKQELSDDILALTDAISKQYGAKSEDDR